MSCANIYCIYFGQTNSPPYQLFEILVVKHYLICSENGKDCSVVSLLRCPRAASFRCRGRRRVYYFGIHFKTIWMNFIIFLVGTGSWRDARGSFGVNLFTVSVLATDHRVFRSVKEFIDANRWENNLWNQYLLDHLILMYSNLI